MADVLTDDELDQQEEEQRRQQAIGKPIVGPTYGQAHPELQGAIGAPLPPPPKPVPASMPPPEVAPATPTSPDTISGMGPLTPAGAQPKAPLTPRPVYHGLNRVLDTIAGTTKIGSSIEAAGGLGTVGWRQQRADEEAQIAEAEKERQANATAEETGARAEETQAKAGTEKTGSELVDVTLPDGTKTQVMRKNLAAPTTALIAGQSRENVAGTNAASREDVAQTNVGGREETARIMVGGKALGTKNVMVGDKPHVMMWNQSTHTYDKDLGEAPPPASASAPYAKTRTVNLIDPESGLPTTYQYNSETNSYDKPVGVSATGAYGHEMAQAGAVERSGTQLVQDIKAHQQDLGTLSTWVKKYGLNTPIADPELARLQAELGTFSALQPAMHGFRSRSAMETFDAIIGGLQKNPEATIASIEGILQTARQINPVPAKGGGRAGAQTTPPTAGGFAAWKSKQVTP